MNFLESKLTTQKIITVMLNTIQEKQKIEYFNEFNQTGKTEYTISHDTNFCSRPEIKKNVIQLHCSDEKLVPHFSSRFFIKNDWEDVSHIIGDLNSTFESKDKDYAEDVTNWQLFYKFPNSFDIKNIYKPNFIDELQSTFEINDINWAKTIYTNWLTKEQFNRLQRPYSKKSNCTTGISFLVNTTIDYEQTEASSNITKFQ